MSSTLVAPGFTLKNGCRLEKVVGRGGMGTVFLAQSPKGAKLAIKSLHLYQLEEEKRKEAVKQFESEAKLLKALSHKGLVKVYDCVEEEDNHFLLMEYIDGITLAQAVKRKKGFFSQEQCSSLIRQLCEVLHYLHTRPTPVIFRDLKPSNVMLTRKSQIKLIDFGIARHFHDESQTQTFLKGVGSAGYAPLEQYGAGTTDPRSDIYALGATIYTLLCKERPPAVVSIVAGIEQLKSIRSLNPEVPSYLEAVVGRMMALRKEQRYSSVAELADALLHPPEDEEDPTGTLNLARKRADKAEIGPCLVCKRVGPEATPFYPPHCPLVVVSVEPELNATLVLGLKEESDPQCGLHFQKGSRKAHVSSDIDLGFPGAAALVLADSEAKSIRGPELLARIKIELLSMATYLLDQFHRLEEEFKLAAVPVLERLALHQPKDSMRIHQAILEVYSRSLREDSPLLQKTRQKLAQELQESGQGEEAKALLQTSFSQHLKESETLARQGHSQLATESRLLALRDWLEGALGPTELDSLLKPWSDQRASTGNDPEMPYQRALGEAEKIHSPHALSQALFCFAKHKMDRAAPTEARTMAERALKILEDESGPESAELYPYVQLLAEVYEALKLPQKVEFRSRALILKYKAKKS